MVPGIRLGRQRGTKAGGVGLAALTVGIALCGAAGCVVENNPPPTPAYTEIEFQETTNLGEYCGGQLTSWTVTNRETTDTGTAGCEQPVIFTNLNPGTIYDFDVVGYAGSRLCWQGSCSVEAYGGTTTFADCSPQIAHLCGF